MVVIDIVEVEHQVLELVEDEIVDQDHDHQEIVSEMDAVV